MATVVPTLLLLAEAPALAGRLWASPSLAEALSAATASADGGVVVVAGSLYLIGALIGSGALQQSG